MAKANTGEPIKRFWKHVNIKGINDCWEWTACLSRAHNGYGDFYVKRGHHEGAHRFIWKYFNGPISNGLYVLHKCNNSKCVNPNHLYLGTQKDNGRDMRLSGHSTKGEKNPQAKLNRRQVREIRKKHIPRKYSCQRLANEYGVHKVTIRDIIRRVNWGWLN